MMNNYRATDPEFMERFEHFAFDEVVNEPEQELEPVTRHTVILAALLGCQGIDIVREELPAALDAGVTPVYIAWYSFGFLPGAGNERENQRAVDGIPAVFCIYHVCHQSWN